MLRIQFLGAAQTVTGSCFLVQNGSQRVLVDCGLVQGRSELTARNRLPFDFDPSGLDVVIVTHAHLDHTGLVPRLIAEGFRGRILTTAITKELLPILWEDAVRVQEPSLYTASDVNHSVARVKGIGMERSYNLLRPAAYDFRTPGIFWVPPSPSCG